MRKIILFIFCFITLIASAQNKNAQYQITGKIGNYNPPAKIYLQYLNEQNKIISNVSELYGGKFSFSGKVDLPINGWLVLSPNGKAITQNDLQSSPDILPIIIFNEDVEVNSTDSLCNATISGSPTNDDAERFSTGIAHISEKMTALGEKIQEIQQTNPALLMDDEYMAQFRQQYRELGTEISNAYIDFIKNNPNSYMSLMGIIYLYQTDESPNTLIPLIEGLGTDIQDHHQIKQLLNQLEQKRLVAIGSVAPDFSQKTPDGQTIKLSEFRGKYLLVDFWASWCRPCRQENPYLVKAYEQFKDKNFEILGVSLDNPGGREAWTNAIKKDGLTWTQVSDLQGWKNAVAVQYGILSIPQNLLLDPNGVIIAKNLKGEELINVLEETLLVIEN